MTLDQVFSTLGLARYKDIIAPGIPCPGFYGITTPYSYRDFEMQVLTVPSPSNSDWDIWMVGIRCPGSTNFVGWDMQTEESRKHCTIAFPAWRMLNGPTNMWWTQRRE